MEDLIENYGELFGEIISDIETHLNSTNIKYQNNVKKSIEVMEKFDNVRLVWEDKKDIALTKDEVKAFITYLNCYENRNIMIGKELIYKGFKYAYIILKKADLLKD